MNPTLTVTACLFAVVFAVLLGIWIGLHIRARSITDLNGVTTIRSTPIESPRIVVNLPPDFKPMTPMPVTEVGGARAVLFYTIYQAAIDDCEFSSALSDAEAAVDKVFGPLST